MIIAITAVTSAFARQTGSVSGVITDENGNPLLGVSVVISELSTGAVTDISGRYTVDQLSAGTYVLRVSYIGYETIEENITIGANRLDKNIILKESLYFLEGLVVTSQKREQENKEVPIAITSYGNEFLTNQGTFEYDALSDFVPGLQVQIQSVNNPGVVIRGITSDNGDSRVEPRVSIFQDGVSISKSRGSVVELYDIERVEVLKGPQGTLFGRGAQIGAMHIIQNKAKNETSGSLKLGYGNFNQFLATGYFNTPIVSDKLLIRAAGIFNRRDGFIENVSGGNLNGKETMAFRGSLKYLPSQNTTIDLIINWQKDTPPGTSFKSGTFSPLGGDLNPNTAADLERGEELGVDRTVYGITGILKQVINQNWDFTAITAYRGFDSDEAFDADGTASPVLFFREIAEGKQFSQELRFNYTNGSRLSGFTGVNFFYENGSQSVPWEVDERSFATLLFAPESLIINGVPTLLPGIPDNPAFGPLAGLPLSSFNKETFTNFGENYSTDIFADLSFDLTDKFLVTLGLRATWEDINAGYEVTDAQTPALLGNITGNFPNNLFTTTNGERIEASDNFFSTVGRFALSYDLNDEITFFGNISRGRRPNVINVSATQTNTLSDEIVWSYEIGGKSLLLNNRLQFDLNGFIYDYSNFQTNVTVLEGGTLISRSEDSGNASAKGFEAAIQYAFGNKGSFFANYGFIDASFDEQDSNGNEQDLAGNTFRLTPKHSFSAGFNLNLNIDKHLNLFLRPSFTYKSKVFFEETNLPEIAQDGYGLLNFRTGLVYKKNYEITFYVQNALDEEFIVDAGNTGQAFGIPTFIAGPPRFFGTQISARF